MSDPTTCETCGKDGCRPRFYPAPREWLYTETKCTNDDGDKAYIIAHFCSMACATAAIKQGPGPRFDMAALDKGDGNGDG